MSVYYKSVVGIQLPRNKPGVNSANECYNRNMSNIIPLDFFHSFFVEPCHLGRAVVNDAWLA